MLYILFLMLSFYRCRYDCTANKRCSMHTKQNSSVSTSTGNLDSGAVRKSPSESRSRAPVPVSRAQLTVVLSLPEGATAQAFEVIFSGYWGIWDQFHCIMRHWSSSASLFSEIDLKRLSIPTENHHKCLRSSSPSGKLSTPVSWARDTGIWGRYSSQKQDIE